MGLKKTRKDLLIAYIFILPSIILLSILILYPLIRSFHLGFLNSSFVIKNPVFIGFRNYTEALMSLSFWKVVRNSTVWTVVVVFFQFLIGLSFALFLNKKLLIGRNIMRSLILIPWVIPGIIVGIIWKFIYHPQIGLFNSILIRLGLIDSYVAPLASEKTALFAVIIVAIWKGFPFSTVVYLAALQSVSKDAIESAMIDGASYFQRLVHIVIPSMSRIIKITLLLTTIWTFNYFDITYAMTRGGPNRATQIFPLEIYNQAFSQFKFSYAAAVAILSLIVILFFSQFYIRELRRTQSL